MTTSRCSHLPEVLPDCTSSAAPMVKTVEDCSSLVNGQPQYVMQVSAKDGQLLSTVVRTLATQRYSSTKPNQLNYIGKKVKGKEGGIITRFKCL